MLYHLTLTRINGIKNASINNVKVNSLIEPGLDIILSNVYVEENMFVVVLTVGLLVPYNTCALSF